MRFFVISMVLIFETLAPAIGKEDDSADQVVFANGSRAFGKVYTTLIRERDLRRSPPWPERAENPPVSARKAIKLTDGKKEQLVRDTVRFKWQRESVALEAFRDEEPSREIFYWHIRYIAHDTHGSTGIPSSLDLFVLMDGSLIEPIISSDQ